MATITSLGAGSGLDLEGLVTKLMAAEQAPLTALQKKESSYNTQISAYGSLKSKLSSLQTAAKALVPTGTQSALNKFATYTTSSSDSTIASASASSGAIAGTYSLNVTKLAVAQTSLSAASTSPSIGDTLTIAYASPTDSRNKTFTIDSSNNSLSGLRDAINNANIGISATIITGTGGPQLSLTGQGGTANAFTLTGTGNLANVFTTPTTADNAQFSINGISATSSTNTVTGALDGMTLTLSKIGTTTIGVTQDNTTNLTSSLNAFISAYNDAVSLMTTQGAYNKTTKTGGPLQGNSTLRDAQATVRNTMFSTASAGTSTYKRMSDIGVSLGADGKLSLDSSKLSKALAADANGVASVVSAIGTAYNSGLDRLVGTSGSIQTATDSTNKLIKSSTDQEAKIQLRLTALEARYRKQFSALDTLVSNMKSTSTYLTQQLSSLSSSSSK